MLTAPTLDAASTALLVAGFSTTFFAYKFSKSFVIGIGGFLFGLFLWNEVVPQFGEFSTAQIGCDWSAGYSV